MEVTVTIVVAHDNGDTEKKTLCMYFDSYDQYADWLQQSGMWAYTVVNA